MEVRTEAYVEKNNGQKTLYKPRVFIMVAMDENEKPTRTELGAADAP